MECRICERGSLRRSSALLISPRACNPASNFPEIPQQIWGSLQHARWLQRSPKRLTTVESLLGHGHQSSRGTNAAVQLDIATVCGQPTAVETRRSSSWHTRPNLSWPERKTSKTARMSSSFGCVAPNVTLNCEDVMSMSLRQIEMLARDIRTSLVARSPPSL